MEKVVDQYNKWTSLEYDARQWLMLVAPIILILSMFAAFKGLVAWLGDPLGYLTAFLVYWIGWCLLLPAVALGGPGQVLTLFDEGQVHITKLGWKSYALLWGPIIFPLVFMFIPRLGRVNFPILLLSIFLGLVIGVTEEILWRGVYVRLFPENLWLNTVYPSIMFGLWHLAPQSVRTNTLPGGAASFVLYAVLLGLAYAYYARRTGSIRWCTVAHCVHDILGLGAFAYAAWLI